MIQVFVRTNRFKPSEPQYSPSIAIGLVEACDDTLVLTDAALTGLGRIFKAGYRYKKAGVVLSGISAKGAAATRAYLMIIAGITNQLS